RCTRARSKQNRPVTLLAHKGDDVSIGILEPGVLQRPRKVYVALTGYARHVVVLECDAPRVEIFHERVNVGDHPRRGRRLVGTGELGMIDEHVRTSALV